VTAAERKGSDETMWNYRKQVARDLERWHDAGWLTGDGLSAIRQDLDARGFGIGYIGSFAILGAILIGFAAMSFVAANWQEMPRLARLLMLLATLWAAYGAAGVLRNKGLTLFSDAAVLIGCGLFGASIMLIAQMFHIDGHPPDAILTWAVGSMLAGVLFRSPPALGLTMLLAVLWGGWEQVMSQQAFWWFLPVWASISAAYWWLGWRRGLHFSGAALALFVICLGYIFERSAFSHELVALLGLVVSGGAIAVRQSLPESWDDELTVVLGYAMLVTFAGLYAAQFFDKIPTSSLAVVAAMTLALLAAAIFWASKCEQRAILRLAYAGFAVEILTLYFRTVGTLLGSSLFFLVAGLLIMGLAAGAYKLHTRQQALEANPHV
jgi:uncharacterized membrane protein